MTLPKSLTTITPLSKILAGILFITLPFLGFYLGMKYQASISSKVAVPTTVPASVKAPAISTDPTANWKTYTNENFSYNIKYPDKWVTIPSIIKGSKTEVVGLHGSELLGKIIYLYSNYPLNPTMPFLQIEASMNETPESYSTRKQGQQNSQNVTIHGYPAITNKQKVLPEPGTNITKNGYRYSWLVFNSKLNSIYDIICYEDLSSENLCNQILSTFRFTK